MFLYTENAESGLEVKEIYGYIDPQGLWYYNYSKDARERIKTKLENETHNEINKIRDEYIKASKKGIPSSRLYKKLKRIFLNTGVDIRFVPYEKLKNEPPCAGANYKP